MSGIVVAFAALFILLSSTAYSASPDSVLIGEGDLHITGGGSLVFSDGSVQSTAAGGGGTVTSVSTGAGLAGGPITKSGTIYIPNGGITSLMLSSILPLSIANGGTGSATKNFVDLSTTQTVGGAKTFSSRIGSTVATGTAPLQVASTTMVTNLNAEMVGGRTLTDIDLTYQKKYFRVAVVEPYGHGNYTNPAAAMADSSNWCPSPSRTGPCLLKIMPGYYDLTNPSSVQMQPYIDIEGSGEKVTIISGTIDALDSGVVTGASNAEIRFLTVENRGGSGHANSNGINIANSSPAITNVTASASGGTFSVGVYNNANSSPTMTNVTASASGGDCIGVYNLNSSSPAMTNVTASASASGGTCIGVYNDSSSSPAMTNVTASASGGGTYNYGVANSSSSPTMTNVTAKASGGTDNFGVANYSSSPTMTNVIVSASGGTLNYGVYNTISSSPTMSNLTITAKDGTTNYGVYNENNSSPTMSNLAVSASGGTSSYGIYNDQSAPVMRDMAVSALNGSSYTVAIYNLNNSYPFLINVTANANAAGTGTYAFGLYNINTAGLVDVNRSTFSGLGGTGDTKGIHNDSTSPINVGSSKISGGVTGNVKCVTSYNGNYDTLNSSCQ